MEVIILGSGSPLPDPKRAGPATMVRVGEKSLLFDCGRAVLMRAAEAGVKVADLTAVFLTHLHSDHCTDFNDILSSRWIFSHHRNPVAVFGPVGTKQFADDTMTMLGQDIHFRREHMPVLAATPGPEMTVTEMTPGDVHEEDGIRITCAETDHAPVHPTLGYRIEAEGKVVAIAGDTLKCPGLIEIAAGADVLVETVLRLDLIEQMGVEHAKKAADYISSPEAAGEAAAEAGVGTLILTHMVPPPVPGEEDEWIRRAKLAYDGEVLVAHDLLTVTL